MRQRGSIGFLKYAVISLLLTGCINPPTQVSEPDSTPAPVALSELTGATPRPDPILRYGNSSPYEVNGQIYEVMASSLGYREQGVASWYGAKFHGRPTANGEIYDAYAATAAHRTLPLPTYVRVTNLQNQRELVVRVNDRGPFHSDRLIDLSYGAALQLGFAEQGIVPVRIEAIHLAGVEDRRFIATESYRYLQVGAFESQLRARELADRIAERSVYVAEVSPVDTQVGRLYRVRVGPFGDSAALAIAQGELLQAGFSDTDLIP